MRILVVALLVGGCKHTHERTSVDPDFDAFEKKWVAEGDVLVERARKEGKPVTDADRKGLEAYPSIFIDKTGVIIDRKRVATLDELKTKRDQLRSAIDQNIAFMPSVHMNGAMVVFALGDEPAQVAIDALDLFAYKKVALAVPAGPGYDVVAADIFCDKPLLENKPRPNTDRPRLSIYLTAKDTWIGTSIANEFIEIPDQGAERDLEKLKDDLRERKASDVFADRNDIELAADAGTASDVISTVKIACEEGFDNLAIVPPDKLTAKPRF